MGVNSDVECRDVIVAWCGTASQANGGAVNILLTDWEGLVP
jgi:hypothetical protein